MAKFGTPTDHYDGRKFRNTVPRKHGFMDLLRWMRNRQQGPWTRIENAPLGEKPVPRVPTEGDAPDSLRLTFVNHSTFLIQAFGLNMLTDPIWSERASPVQWAGPRRMRNPAIRLEDLPKIDVVLLSHDHYDHMDLDSLRRLEREHHPAFYTGLGNARRLKKLGIKKTVEMDWWESQEIANGLTLTCTPAQHFSGRTPLDRDTTLWCSFMLTPPKSLADSGEIYFGADTGIGPHFGQIAERFRNIRLAILPIGAYRPEWFMGEVHCSPREAVEAHSILGPQLSVACHFGTFPLADDGQNEAEDALAVVLHERGLEGEFLVPEFGRPMNIPSYDGSRNGERNEDQPTGTER